MNGTLKHYGVKGMKWGVRRDRRSVNASDRTSIKKTITKANNDIKRSGKQTKTNTKPVIKGNKQLGKQFKKMAKDVRKQEFKDPELKARAKSKYDKFVKDIDSYAKKEGSLITMALKQPEGPKRDKLYQEAINMSIKADNLRRKAQKDKEIMYYEQKEILKREVGIKHYGVKGMKWGVRRDRRSSSSARKQARLETKQTIKTNKARVKHKRVSAMTDKELQDKVTRLNLERQYSNLTGRKVSTGMDTIREIVGSVGKKVVKTQAAESINYAIDKKKKQQRSK